MADNPIKWSAFGTHVHVFAGATLKNMAADAVATSGEIDNSAGNMYADFILTFNPTAVFHAGDYVRCWLIKATDGTNYETLLSGTVPPRAADIIFPLGVEAASGHASQIVTIGPVLLPAGKFKVVLQNKTNETTENSDDVSILDMYPYNANLVSA